MYWRDGSSKHHQKPMRIVYGGLHSACVRHATLLINDSTLDDHETQNVTPDTSWLDAPPLNISSRLRGPASPLANGGRLSRIIDRTAEKEKLAAATHEEALRILRAQNRFVGGTRMRLSDLVQLETDEFDRPPRISRRDGNCGRRFS